jgi:hypothetical protein
MKLQVVEDGAGHDRLDALSGRLRTVLASAGFSGARPLQAVAPDGGKSGTGFVFGALVVSLQPEVLQACLETVRRWVEGRSAHRVRISLDGDELEIDGRISRADQRRLIDAFLRRHGDAAGGQPAS